MVDLIISEHGNELVVDSRLIAEGLGIAHESFMATIRKYETQTEEAFGRLRFEIGVPSSPTGNPPQYVLLNEEQATFLMTLSRNTPQVVECKANLVLAFSKAKKALHPSSSLQALQFAVNQLVEQERRQLELERQQKTTEVRVEVIEQRLDGLNSADTGYQTVRAYCRLHSFNIPIHQAKTIGKIAGRLCRERAIAIGTVADEMYGNVNSYPVEVLAEAIAHIQQPVLS